MSFVVSCTMVVGLRDSTKYTTPSISTTRRTQTAAEIAGALLMGAAVAASQLLSETYSCCTRLSTARVCMAVTLALGRTAAIALDSCASVGGTGTDGYW